MQKQINSHSDTANANRPVLHAATLKREPPPPLLTAKLLARRWHLSPRTLERWRTERRGPTFVRLVGSHGRVLYRLLDVIEYEKKNTHSLADRELGPGGEVQ
jgi:hypothetical protein